MNTAGSLVGLLVSSLEEDDNETELSSSGSEEGSDEEEQKKEEAAESGSSAATASNTDEKKTSSRHSRKPSSLSSHRRGFGHQTKLAQQGTADAYRTPMQAQLLRAFPFLTEGEIAHHSRHLKPRSSFYQAPPLKSIPSTREDSGDPLELMYPLLSFIRRVPLKQGKYTSVESAALVREEDLQTARQAARELHTREQRAQLELELVALNDIAEGQAAQGPPLGAFTPEILEYAPPDGFVLVEREEKEHAVPDSIVPLETVRIVQRILDYLQLLNRKYVAKIREANRFEKQLAQGKASSRFASARHGDTIVMGGPSSSASPLSSLLLGPGQRRAAPHHTSMGAVGAAVTAVSALSTKAGSAAESGEVESQGWGPGLSSAEEESSADEKKDDVRRRRGASGRKNRSSSSSQDKKGKRRRRRKKKKESAVERNVHVPRGPDHGMRHDTRLSTTIKVAVRCACAVRGQLWSSEREGQITVREPRSGLVTQSMDTPERVWCLYFVEESNSVWAGTKRGPILIYGATSMKLLYTAHQHAGGVYVVKAGKAGVFSGSNDFSVCRWTARGQYRATYTGHTNSVRCILLLGRYSMWTGGDDLTIKLWNLETGACTHTLHTHSGSVLDLLPVGRRVLSASEDGTICVWKVRDSGGGLGGPQCLQQIEVPGRRRVNALCHMGGHVWACGQDSRVHVYRTRDLSYVHSLDKHSAKYVNSFTKFEFQVTRALWSYSLGGGLSPSVCVWRSEMQTAEDPEELLARAVLEIDVLEVKVQTMLLEAAQLRHDLEEQRAFNVHQQRHFEHELERLVTQLAKAAMGREAMVALIGELRMQVRSLLDHNQELRGDLRQHLADTGLTRKQMEMILTRLSNREDQVLRLMNELVSMKAELTGRVETAENELAACHSLLADARHRADSQAREISRLKKTLAQEREANEKALARERTTIRNLKEELHHEQRRKEIAQDELEAMRQAAADVAAALTMKTELLAVRRDNAKLQSRCALLEGNVGRLQDQLASEQAEAATARQRVEELNALLEAQRLEAEGQQAGLRADVGRHSQQLERLRQLNAYLRRTVEQHPAAFRLAAVARELRGVASRLASIRRQPLDLAHQPLTCFNLDDRTRALPAGFQHEVGECGRRVHRIMEQCLARDLRLHVGSQTVGQAADHLPAGDEHSPPSPGDGSSSSSSSSSNGAATSSEQTAATPPPRRKSPSAAAAAASASTSVLISGLSLSSNRDLASALDRSDRQKKESFLYGLAGQPRRPQSAITSRTGGRRARLLRGTTRESKG